MTLAILLLAITNILIGLVAIWQRAHAGRAAVDRLDGMLAVEQARIDHLLSLLAKREAPAEEAWYMSDQAPAAPLVPANARWSDDGLTYWIPEEDDN